MRKGNVSRLEGAPSGDADLRVAILHGFLRRETPADFLRAQGTIADGVPDPLVLALAAGQCLNISTGSWDRGNLRDLF